MLNEKGKRKDVNVRPLSSKASQTIFLNKRFPQRHRITTEYIQIPESFSLTDN